MQQRTSRIARWISKDLIAAVLLSGCFIGCASSETRPAGEPAQTVSQQRIYFSSFDEVWRAAHAVLKYTIANENPDTGVIETEYIKGVDGWLAPEQKRSPSNGLRYKITLTLAKGNTEGHASTRVTIEKHIEILRDFFSEPQIVESDGYEETVILYRLERELVINDALKRAG